MTRNENLTNIRYDNAANSLLACAPEMNSIHSQEFCGEIFDFTLFRNAYCGLSLKLYPPSRPTLYFYPIITTNPEVLRLNFV